MNSRFNLSVLFGIGLLFVLGGTIAIDDEPRPDQRVHYLALFSSATNKAHQSFLKIINHSPTDGEAYIVAYDDEGNLFGPLSLAIEANAAIYLNSSDLEHGNSDLGLEGITGSGQGDWQLVISSDLDLDVLSYVQSGDGFVTSTHNTVPSEAGEYHLAIFKPGSDSRLESRLRLTNRSAEATYVTITGVDDLGHAPGPGVSVRIPAHASRTYTSSELESGSRADVNGYLGDGVGRWRLTLESTDDILVLNLLASSSGPLTNLSTPPIRRTAGAYSVPLFPPVSNELRQQGFVRIVNLSNEAGSIEIQPYDDSDHAYDPLYLSINANEAKQFTADYLEFGNDATGLIGSTGAGEGNWRLDLKSDLPIHVSAYIQASDGFITPIHDTAARYGREYEVALLNLAPFVTGSSLLRLVNHKHETVIVHIEGYDDKGRKSSQVLRIELLPFSVTELTEESHSKFLGELANSERSWRLSIRSSTAIQVMNLFVDARGRVSNLSVAPDSHFAPIDEIDFRDRVGEGWVIARDTLNVQFLDDHRFQANDGDVAGGGEYRYRRTGRNQANIDLVFNNGEECSVQLHFSSSAVVVHKSTCEPGVNASWRLVQYSLPPVPLSDEIPPPFRLDVENTDAVGLTHANGELFVPDENGHVYVYTTTGDRLESAEFDLDASNDDPQGITYANGKLYVVDGDDLHVYVYTASGARDAAADFDLDVANDRATGITYANGRLHVVDDFRTVYAYQLTGERDTELEFRVVFDNLFPRGITFANEHFYVVDSYDEIVFAYTHSGERAEDLDFQMSPDTRFAYGITHDGQWFYVVSHTRNRIWTYSGDERPPDGPDLAVILADPTPLQLNPSETFELDVFVRNEGNMASATSILRYYESENRWIAPNDTEIGTQEIATLEPDQILTHSFTVMAPDTPGTYHYGACIDIVTDEIDEENNCSYALDVTVKENETPPNPGGLRPNVTHFASDSDSSRYDGLVYAEGALYALVGAFSYDVHGFDPSGTRNTNLDFRLNHDNRHAERIAYANGKLYVIDELDERVYAYDRDGSRPTSLDFELDPNQFDPDGFTFAEDVFFIVDERYTNDRVIAYSVSGQRIPTADFDLHDDNGGSVGIAYANGRLFVLDVFELKVFAYTTAGERIPTLEFTLDSSNANPRALTYGEGRFFVAGEDGIFVYAFDDDSGIAAPDLSASVSQTNRRVGTGSSVTLNAIVTNRGDLATVESTLRYFRSNDGEIDSSDTEIGSTAVTALDPSSQSEHALDIEMDEGPGTYFYGACVDAVANESSTTNNCSASFRVVVAEMGGPDLAVVSVQRSHQTWTRHPLTVTALVQNRGDEKSAVTSLRVYLSTDAQISTSDIEVAEATLDTLLPGASRNYTTTVFSPGDPDTYYYGVCADSLSAESDTTNNCSLAFEVSTTLQVCSLGLDGENDQPAGAAHANGMLFIPDRGYGWRTFAYSTSGNRISEADFELSSSNRSPYRATFANDTLYVVDSYADTVFAYTASGERLADDDLTLETEDISGIAYADGFLYFLDDDIGSVLGYTLSGERVPSADFDLDPYNSDPTGIVFANSWFFVVDETDQKVYAYDASGTRFVDEEFDLHVSNVSPVGIAFDGNQFHVADGFNDELYTYPHHGDPAAARPCFREGVLATRTLLENTPPGINVGEPVRVNGNDAAQYNLAGDDASHFVIDPTTGQIRTRDGVVYDYESNDQYDLEVAVAYDDGEPLDHIGVTIDVLDENSSCFLDFQLSPRVLASDGRLTLHWTPAPIDEFDRAARILGYETQIRQWFARDWSDQRTFYSTNVHSVVYDGLENDVEYEIGVRSINAEEECDWFTSIRSTPTTDLAPANFVEYQDRFGPYPLGSRERNIRVLSPSRCRHTTGAASLDANCTYERTGPHTADIVLEFDDPSKGSCSVSLAYSSLTAGSFIDECFDAGVNTKVDFDAGFHMPSDGSDGLPSVEVARAPRSQEEFDVLAWGREDLIPGLGFGCPSHFVTCEFSPGNGYLIGRDPDTGLWHFNHGEYSYENTGLTSGTLMFRSAEGTEYEIELEFAESGQVRTTIKETTATGAGWPAMPHLDLELGAPTILLPIPTSWEAALAVETDFSNIDEGVVINRLLNELFPDFGQLFTSDKEAPLQFKQEYTRIGKNRAVHTVEIPRRPDWVFDGLPEEERERKRMLNGSKWVVTLDFNSEGSAFVTIQFTSPGATTTAVEGFIDFLSDEAIIDEFPPELQLPDELPQEPGEDLTDVAVAMAMTESNIESDSFQTMVVSVSSFDFNPGDWLEPKDGGNQRMMIVSSGQSAASRVSSKLRGATSQYKPRFEFVSQVTRSTAVNYPRREASISPSSQVSTDLIELKVVCMQLEHDIPVRGSRFFSKPKVAESPVQLCQKDCVLVGGENIQGCVWDCE